MSKPYYDIPTYMYEEIDKQVTGNLRQLAHRYVFDEEEDFTSQLYHYIDTMFEKHFLNDNQLLIDSTSSFHKFHRRVQTNKKNWVKQLKKDIEEGDSYIHQDWLALKRYFSLQKEQMNTLEDKDTFIQQQLSNIEEWAKDKSQRLADFPYIESKKPFQIKKALDNDLILLIAKVLKDIPSNMISQRANILVDNPIFTDEKTRFPVHQTSSYPNQSNTITRYQDDYNYEQEKIVRSIMELDDNDTLFFKTNFQLDATDSQILDYVINHRDDKLFYKESIVNIDMSALAKHIYQHRGKKQYRLLEKRLHKFAFSRMEGYTVGENNRTTFTLNFFEYVKVVQEGERVTAQIRLSQTLKDQMINNQTIRIYSHYLENLENNISKLLIYNLQKERIDAYIDKRQPQHYYDLQFFISRIRFRARTMQSILKKVSLALDEFLDHDILIESYERDGAGFYIDLKPLTKAEKVDYFSKKDRSIHILP
ncbi:hypothetical protein [Gracilibacillus sp. YIM 98692]|uniref:hypothetical protein n=1 Tax=Gracilibacillus sp. YIM 98692 TaxID=2663532 RepID=UPI0013D63C49|nr:hypothetical protein [Gracilibacillus sp. YIM 98692]